jgi:hypothetical protein
MGKLFPKTVQTLLFEQNTFPFTNDVADIGVAHLNANIFANLRKKSRWCFLDH